MTTAEGPAPAATETPPLKHRRRGLVVALGAAGVVAVTALTVGGYFAFNAAQKFKVVGTMAVHRAENWERVDGGSSCVTVSGYDDLHEGAQVVISDEDSKTIALGELGTGTVDGEDCTFPFTVADVPGGKKFYGIEVTHRGRLQYDEAKLRDGGLELTIGD